MPPAKLRFPLTILTCCLLASCCAAQTASAAEADLGNLISTTLKGSEDERNAALDKLETVAPDFFQPLREITTRPDSLSHAQGVEKLAKLGPAARPALPAILRALELADQTLKAIKDPMQDLVEARDAQRVQVAAVEVLTRFAPVDDSAFEAIRERASLVAIAEVARKAPTRRKTIIDTRALPLDLNDQGRLLDAVEARIACGAAADAESALPALKKLKYSPTAEVAEFASKAIAEIEGAARAVKLVPEKTDWASLLEKMRDQDRFVRQRAQDLIAQEHPENAVYLSWFISPARTRESFENDALDALMKYPMPPDRKMEVLLTYEGSARDIEGPAETPEALGRKAYIAKIGEQVKRLQLLTGPTDKAVAKFMAGLGAAEAQRNTNTTTVTEFAKEIVPLLPADDQPFIGAVLKDARDDRAKCVKGLSEVEEAAALCRLSDDIEFLTEAALLRPAHKDAVLTMFVEIHGLHPFYRGSYSYDYDSSGLARRFLTLESLKNAFLRLGTDALPFLEGELRGIKGTRDSAEQVESVTKLITDIKEGKQPE